MKAADFSQLLSVQMLMLAQGADGPSSFSLFLQSSPSNKCRPLSSSVRTQCSFTCSSCRGTHCCGGKRGQCLQAKRLALQLNGRLLESPSLHCNLKVVSAACLGPVICLAVPVSENVSSTPALASDCRQTGSCQNLIVHGGPRSQDGTEPFESEQLTRAMPEDLCQRGPHQHPAAHSAPQQHRTAPKLSSMRSWQELA